MLRLLTFPQVLCAVSHRGTVPHQIEGPQGRRHIPYITSRKVVAVLILVEDFGETGAVFRPRRRYGEDRPSVAVSVLIRRALPGDVQ